MGGVSAQEAILRGEADEDEPQALTVEYIEKTDPSKLEPLPRAEGLAVSLNYERGSQEHKFKKTARGEKAREGATSLGSVPEEGPLRTGGSEGAVLAVTESPCGSFTAGMSAKVAGPADMPGLHHAWVPCCACGRRRPWASYRECDFCDRWTCEVTPCGIWKLIPVFWRWSWQCVMCTHRSSDNSVGAASGPGKEGKTVRRCNRCSLRVLEHHTCASCGMTHLGACCLVRLSPAQCVDCDPDAETDAESRPLRSSECRPTLPANKGWRVRGTERGDDGPVEAGGDAAAASTLQRRSESGRS